MNPGAYPYTAAIDAALRPFRDEVAALIEDPSASPELNIPARAYLKECKKPLNCPVPFTGNLSAECAARIMNWIEAHIDESIRGHRANWLGLLGHAHAVTLVLAGSLQQPPHEMDPQHEDARQKLLLQAWQLQRNGVPDEFLHVDVDRECLDIFEKRLFDMSADAGEAGEKQWGKAAGLESIQRRTGGVGSY
ncbi:hypothetical protein HGRIS_012037 [Hohenbuehelia grisea]|uniref:Uncharacterized protein n=1 Tax=Hohenbuehelia grisea TaxID=104357 RepID=A0ABR3IR46_9AGAR